MSQEEHKSPTPQTMRQIDEHKGPFWKSPYMLYMGLTAALFIALLIVAWIGWSQGWVAQLGGQR